MSWPVSDEAMGRILSSSALGLALLLRHFHYSTLITVGVLAQYVLSTLVWWPPVHPLVQWGDRMVSVINMVVLSREYRAREASYFYMSLLLAYTVGYKIVDNLVRVGDEVTWYYVGWHFNLVFLNYCIMWWCENYGTRAAAPQWTVRYGVCPQRPCARRACTVLPPPSHQRPLPRASTAPLTPFFRIPCRRFRLGCSSVAWRS